MTSVEVKGTVFPVKFKLQGKRLNKDIKEENFKKVLIKLIETNHQINMTSDHSISTNYFLKSI